MTALRIARLVLHADATLLDPIAAFYGDTLGLPVRSARGEVAVRIGESELLVRPGPGAPFYHLALLVPGDRWEVALAWALERTALLPDPSSGEAVFTFESWDARALYVHDPAGSIVELIAHAGLAANGRTGAFSAEELVGISEVGLVGDAPLLADALLVGLGLRLWDGAVGDEGRLGFVGEKGRTLILAEPGRGWLPTGRPAEPHPVELVLRGVAGRAAGGGHIVTVESDLPAPS